MDPIRLEWDERKNRSNQRKHGVSFEEAQTVFFDERALEYPDPDAEAEPRFLIIGLSLKLQVLLVCHCFRVDDSVIRIISARRATHKERGAYAERAKR